ncbi:MAG: helicase-exonuclease AddAB subunit AddA [Oscillospiraceae bacterium]|jgi:ATP-dependent helicase/nuclease subunit A|nr:helicase-exonuclease AddAB subunit AddA [Oscillospiraceae bacterium]
MPREWTKAQSDAIYAEGGALLVSAAAGSGKTSVLVARVLRLLTGEKPIPADRLLIATFSNAAASEMRSKIENELAELIQKQPGDMSLKKQKMLLNRASIGTVHAFCLKLAREYFHKLDIPPDFRIGEEGELSVLKSQSVRDAVEEFYESGNPDFLALVELMSGGRDDSGLIRVIYSLYDFISSSPFPEKWLKEKLALYDSPAPEDSPWGKVLLDYAKGALSYGRALCRRALDVVNEDENMVRACSKQFQDALYQLESLLISVDAGEWDMIVHKLENFKIPRMGVLRGYGDSREKAFIESVKKTLKTEIAEKLKNGAFSAARADFAEDMDYLRPKIKALFDLTAAFAQKFRQSKLDKNILDFSDLEHGAVRLLADEETLEKTDAAREISRRFDAVMVDEYQDTNEIQDLIFRNISQDGGKNLFMVGDVKQSIYRFRQAMPEIFIRRRKSSAKYDGGTFPAYISLGSNFRSRRGICEGINAIFSRLMSSALGGIDYNSEEKLIPAASFFDERKRETEIMIISAPEEDDGFDSHAREAQAIAERIGEMHDSGFEVAGDNGPRPCGYGDFCLLLRSRKLMPVFEKALAENGLPVWSDAGNSFFGSKEILYMLSLLKAIDNPLSDIEVCAAMMSPMFGFTPDEMAALRLGGGVGIYLSARRGAEAGDEKCGVFTACLDKLRTFAVTSTTERLIQKALDLTGFDLKVSAMKNGAQRLANLNMLIRQAGGYESAGYRGLSGFNRLMDRMREENIDSAHSASVAPPENAVKIMTIHRSKGLEFPVCFVADCGRRFNLTDLNANTLCHPELGFASKRRDSLGRQFSTAPFEAARLELKRDALSEEMRILYVALTRAKEKLFVSFSCDKPKEKILEFDGKFGSERVIPPFAAGNMLSCADWLMAVAARHPAAGEIRGDCGLAAAGPLAEEDDASTKFTIVAPSSSEKNAPAENPVFVSPPDLELLEKLEKLSVYKYPAEYSKKPSKLAVSDIAKEKSFLLKRPKFMYSNGLSPAEKGQAHHKFMQFADYEKARQNPKEEIARLCSLNHITEEEAAAISPAKLRRLFKSKLMKRIFSSPKVMREIKFITALADCDDIADENKTMLQGVADCVFLEEGELVIVDYKTDWVENSDILRSRYSSQLEIYAKALEESFQTSIKELVLYSFALDEEILL